MVVVFDLDGTLIDSRAALLAAHDAAWRSEGLPRPPDAAILSLIGLPLVEIMRTFAPDHPHEPLVRAYREAYAPAAMESDRLFDGIETLLQRPFRAAVATGKSQRGAIRSLAQHGLADRFEIVLGGDSVACAKPAPDLLHAVMRHTRTQNLLMVGDTTYDLEMAQRAGVPALGVAWGHHPVSRLAPLAQVATTVAELDQMLRIRLASASG